jgi:hypothetical protein
VQLLECTCPADCTGGVVLSMYRESMPMLLSTHTAANIKSAIEVRPDVACRAPSAPLCDCHGGSRCGA